jgi:hypothetical protein
VFCEQFGQPVPGFLFLLRFARAPSTAIHSAARSWLWETALHKLPVKSDLRKRIGKQEGDTVIVHLQERI